MIKRQGFTLIELLVVISIIGVLSSVAIVNLSSVRKKARDVTRISDINQLGNGLLLFKERFGEFPRNHGVDYDGDGSNTDDVDDFGTGSTGPYLTDVYYCDYSTTEPGLLVGLLNQGFIQDYFADPRNETINPENNAFHQYVYCHFITDFNDCKAGVYLGFTSYEIPNSDRGQGIPGNCNVLIASPFNQIRAYGYNIFLAN